MKKEYIKKENNQVFNQVLCMQTKEIYDNFVSLIQSGLNITVDRVILNDSEKVDFFNSIKMNPKNCYAVILLK